MLEGLRLEKRTPNDADDAGPPGTASSASLGIWRYQAAVSGCQLLSDPFFLRDLYDGFWHHIIGFAPKLACYFVVS